MDKTQVDRWIYEFQSIYQKRTSDIAEEEWQRMEEIVEEMKKLNKKGLIGRMVSACGQVWPGNMRTY